jgi:hypothetical protein
MAGEYGSRILSAYFQGQQIRKANEAQTHQQELQDKQFDAQVKQFQDQLQQQQGQFNAKQKMEAAQHQAGLDWQKFNAAHIIRQEALNGNVPTTVDPNTGQPMADAGPYGQVSVPTPEEIGKNQYAIAAPKMGAEMTNKAILAAQAAGERAAAAQEKFGYEKQLEEIKQTNVLARDEKNNQVKLAVANIAAAAKKYHDDKKGTAMPLFVDQADLENTVAGMNDGSISIEELKKRGMKAGEIAGLMSKLSEQGIQPMNDKDRTALQGLVPVVEYNKRIEEFASEIAKMSGARKLGNSVLSSIGITTELQSKLNAFKTEVGGYVKSFGRDSGVISDKDIKRFEVALPKLGVLDSKTNAAGLKEIKEAIRSMQNSILSKAKSPEQRQAIIEKWGLISDMVPAKVVGPPSYKDVIEKGVKVPQ